MLKMFTLTLCFVAIVGAGLSAPSSAQVKCAATVSGDLRIESLDSGTYGEKRKIRIWLPAGYDAAENTQHRYPVLYMFDGQTLFDTCTAFSGEGEWEIDETLTRLIAETKIPPMIVVGMDSNSRRGYEYQPWKDVVAEPAALEPIGKVLPAFVVNDVMTYVAGRYRVTADPTRTGIGGASLSGIAALYVLLNRPDRFGLGLIESPTLPLGNGQMLRDTAFLARGPDRVSIGVGTTELAFPGGEGVKFAAQVRMPLTTANAGFARMAETLAENLRAAYLNHPDVTLVVEPNANHTVASWAPLFQSGHNPVRRATLVRHLKQGGRNGGHFPTKPRNATSRDLADSLWARWNGCARSAGSADGTSSATRGNTDSRRPIDQRSRRNFQQGPFTTRGPEF